MITENVVIKEDIVLFRGKLPVSLLIDPIVSNTYFKNDGDKVIIFHPSCGWGILDNAYANQNSTEAQVFRERVRSTQFLHWLPAFNTLAVDAPDKK